MHQVKRFSYRTKGEGRFNFSFSQNGGRENIRKHKYQGNTATHVDIIPKGNGEIYDDIKCYVCQTLGNYADQFPGQTGTGGTKKDRIWCVCNGICWYNK